MKMIHMIMVTLEWFSGLCIVLMLIIIVILFGCAYNPCIDNPRNMQCMTAEELEEAL